MIQVATRKQVARAIEKRRQRRANGQLTGNYSEDANMQGLCCCAECVAADPSRKPAAQAMARDRRELRQNLKRLREKGWG